jgi:RNA polymerase sigma-70 factor (ECF subfamily)
MALARDATHVEAFDALFSTYHDDVYGLAQVLLRNEQDAEDVTQDVFLRAYRALPFYQPERATLRTWLTHMTVNACKTHRRRNFLRNLLRGSRSDSQRVLDEEQARISPDPSAWGAPEEHVLQVELRQSIQEVLARLRLEHRTVVVLHYYRNFSCQEIARIVGCPEGTVRSRLHYARRLVKVHLEQRTLSPMWEEEL